MSDASEITTQLVALLREELDSRRTSIARLAEVSGVARGTIYAVMQSQDNSGSLRVLGKLAEAVGASIEIRITPGDGPAHDKKPRRNAAAAAAESEDAPPVHRWLKDEVVNKAWQNHPQDVAATAKALRMPQPACRLRLLVMGLIRSDDPQEADLLRIYQAIADARWQGLQFEVIAARVQRSEREVRSVLRTMAISGRRGRPAAG